MELDKNDFHTVVPEHYWWCQECWALTPHIKLSEKEMRFPWLTWECEVCGNQDGYEYGCPNCGYPEPEMPDLHEIIIHGHGCHFRREEEEMVSHAELVVNDFYASYKRMLKNMFPKHMRRNVVAWSSKDSRYKLYKKYVSKMTKELERQCDCPRKIVYDSLNVHNYKTYSATHLDCWNAVEWEYDIRCEKCGFWYDVSDGNC